MKEIKSGRWNYQLKCGKALRDAIHDENPGEILEMIMKAYQELLDNDMIDDYDFESYTEDIEMYMDDIEDEDIEDNIDYELDNLYDLCDNIGVWIPIG